MSEHNQTAEETTTPPARRSRPPSKTVAAGPKGEIAPGTADQAKVDKMNVEQATLHSSVMFQGVTADNWNEAKAPGTKMLWVKGEGLLLGRNGKEMLVPSANVKGVIFASKNNGRIVES